MKPCRAGCGAESSQGQLLPTLPLRGRDQLPQFTPPRAPSWAQSAALAAPAPKLGAAGLTGGCPAAPTRGAGMSPRTPRSLSSCSRASPCACLSFPSSQKDGCPPPTRSSEAMLPLLRPAGRVQPSGDLHPHGSERPPHGGGGTREGASPARPPLSPGTPLGGGRGPRCHRSGPGGWQGRLAPAPAAPCLGGTRPHRGVPSSAGTQLFCQLAHSFSFCQKSGFQPVSP